MYQHAPIIFIVMPWVLTYIILRHIYYGWRESIIAASIIWGVILTLITEASSTFGILSFFCLIISWGGISLVLLFAYLKIKKRKIKKLTIGQITKFSSILIPIFGIVFISATLGLIALVSPPNNWDSMTYHMSRVVHWIQNNSVAHYPTNILRQLDMSPWSEFVIMHLQILSNGDRFANFVQWLSMLGSIIGVSLIAKLLGAEKNGQILSSVVCLTIPMGILQSSSTQNDYVVSFWLVCFVYYLLMIFKSNNSNISVIDSLYLGSALGLAILSKSTAYIYAFPFCVWLFIVLLKYYKWKSVKPLLVLIALTFSINLGHFYRNLELFKTPLGISGKIAVNESFDILSLLSNVVRNISLHIATPYQSINQFLQNAIYYLHQLLGIDVNNPLTTFANEKFNILNHSIPSDENNVGNLIHFLLIIFVMIFYLIQKKLRDRNIILIYLVSTVATFFIFCFVLKWQPWGSRLHLPIFVLYSPFIGTVLSHSFKNRIIVFTSFFLLTYSLPYVFHNTSRPLAMINGISNNLGGSVLSVNRINQYFSNRPNLKSPYTDAIDFVKSKECSDIGLLIGDDSWEYPFWVISRNYPKNAFRFKHINVKNFSSAKSINSSYSKFIPCSIISVESGEHEIIISEGRTYHKGWSSHPVTVFSEVVIK
jgi:hypothetical protein